MVFLLSYYPNSYNPFEGPNENPEAELPLTAGEYIYVYGNMDEDGFFEGRTVCRDYPVHSPATEDLGPSGPQHTQSSPAKGCSEIQDSQKGKRKWRRPGLARFIFVLIGREWQS